MKLLCSYIANHTADVWPIYQCPRCFLFESHITCKTWWSRQELLPAPVSCGPRARQQNGFVMLNQLEPIVESCNGTMTRSSRYCSTPANSNSATFRRPPALQIQRTYVLYIASTVGSSSFTPHMCNVCSIKSSSDMPLEFGKQNLVTADTNQMLVLRYGLMTFLLDDILGRPTQQTDINSPCLVALT